MSCMKGEGFRMSGKWDTDPAAGFRRRLGKSAHELGSTGGTASCSELWELDNGDVAVIGTELTEAYKGRCRSASASTQVSVSW